MWLPPNPKRTVEIKLKSGKIVKGFKIRESKTKKSFVLEVQQYPVNVEKSYLKKDIEQLSIAGEQIEMLNKPKLNLEMQYYKGLPLRLINRGDYKDKKAKRYTINNTNQNIWIPNRYLEEDGTIKDGADIMFVFKNAQRQLELAGYKFKY